MTTILCEVILPFSKYNEKDELETFEPAFSGVLEFPDNAETRKLIENGYIKEKIGVNYA